MMENRKYPWLEVVALQETDSTSNQAKRYPARKEMTVITAQFQTAGKGQRGNSWESAPGANLLFSIVFSPQDVTAANQFILSQAISLAVQETLEEYAQPFRIKWPNDIYWKDKKICGILIENELCSKRIDKCVIGIGININQAEFQSPAPNPISLLQITGQETNRDILLYKVLERFRHYLQQISQGNSHEIADAYHRVLYRNNGYYRYCDAHGEFMASIDHVEPQGFLCLKDDKGQIRQYAFKEVSIILENEHLSL